MWPSPLPVPCSLPVHAVLLLLPWLARPPALPLPLQGQEPLEEDEEGDYEEEAEEVDEDEEDEGVVVVEPTSGEGQGGREGQGGQRAAGWVGGVERAGEGRP